MGRSKKKNYDCEDMDFDNPDLLDNQPQEEGDLYEDDIYDEFMDEMRDEDLESDSERKKNLKKEFYVKRSGFKRGITKVPGVKENRP